jgi:hypothetical protein
MTLQEAIKLVSPGDPFLSNMVKALQMHPWLNTEQDTKRLEAAKLILRNKKRIKFVGGKERYQVV